MCNDVGKGVLNLGLGGACVLPGGPHRAAWGHCLTCYLAFDIKCVTAQSGANKESLDHEDYLNAPGETVSSKFTTPGEYSYYCEPHQGAGMAGKVIVQ